METWEAGVTSIVLHPAVLLDKGIDHLLHGQVRDQLVLGQGTPGDWVEVAHSLQREKVMLASVGEAKYYANEPSVQTFSSL